MDFTEDDLTEAEAAYADQDGACDSAAMRAALAAVAPRIAERARQQERDALEAEFTRLHENDMDPWYWTDAAAVVRMRGMTDD